MVSRSSFSRNARSSSGSGWHNNLRGEPSRSRPLMIAERMVSGVCPSAWASKFKMMRCRSTAGGDVLDVLDGEMIRGRASAPARGRTPPAPARRAASCRTARTSGRARALPSARAASPSPAGSRTPGRAARPAPRGRRSRTSRMAARSSTGDRLSSSRWMVRSTIRPSSSRLG